MAQGLLKKGKPPAPKPSQRKQNGSRVIKPKKEALKKQQKANHKHTSGLTAMTEKQLASRAGHLEILHGGKKDSKAQDAAMKHAQKIKK